MNRKFDEHSLVPYKCYRNNDITFVYIGEGVSEKQHTIFVIKYLYDKTQAWKFGSDWYLGAMYEEIVDNKEAIRFARFMTL
jgi:hypothetical protein